VRTFHLQTPRSDCHEDSRLKRPLPGGKPLRCALNSPARIDRDSLGPAEPGNGFAHATASAAMLSRRLTPGAESGALFCRRISARRSSALPRMPVRGACSPMRRQSFRITASMIESGILAEADPAELRNQMGYMSKWESMSLILEILHVRPRLGTDKLRTPWR